MSAAKKATRVSVITGNFDKVLETKRMFIRLYGIVPYPGVVYEEEDDEAEDEGGEGDE